MMSDELMPLIITIRRNKAKDVWDAYEEYFPNPVIDGRVARHDTLVVCRQKVQALMQERGYDGQSPWTHDEEMQTSRAAFFVRGPYDQEGE